MSLRVYEMVRDADVSGVSGTGLVAEVVEFSNGIAVVSWSWSDNPSVTMHINGAASVRSIHGHNGSTRLRLIYGA